MAKYQVIGVTPDGRRENVRAFACDTDDNAAVWAEQLSDQRQIELWSGHRLVRRLNGRRRTITHVIKDGRMVPKPDT